MSDETPKVPCEPTNPCPQALAAAEHAVRQVFAIVGVDVNDPEKVEQFREELRFGRAVKKSAERGFLAVIGAAAAIGTTAVLHKMGIV